jgi:hypothetical protein
MTTPRLPRLFSHLIQQARLDGVDAVVSPSRLKTGVWNVDGVLGVNCGRGAGVVGLLAACKILVEGGEGVCGHHVPERCRVEIVRV